MNRVALACVCTASLAILGAAALVTAGPIDPPPGPVGPTYRTLLEVEPRIPISLANTPGDADSLYRITQPGSYYLTGNVQGVANKHGIEIAVPASGPGVTIDLAGFEIAGVPNSLSGITVANASTRGLTIRNGLVRAWGQNGINAANSVSSVFERVRVEGVAFDGIYAGPNSTVTLCTASFNGGYGIFVGPYSLITECRANNNTESGIYVNGSGGRISNCSSSLNSKHGFVMSFGGSLTACTAAFNGWSGFSLVAGAAAVDCIAMNNSFDGFNCVDDVRLTNCSARNNLQRGFNMGARPLITNCTATENNLEGIRITDSGLVTACSVERNDGVGIRLLQGGAITDSTVSNNGSHGIRTGPDTPGAVPGTLVARCRVNANGGDGIRVFRDSTVSDNAVTQHPSGAGIRADDFFNTIKDNHVTNGATGILVPTASCTIVRNVCRNNGSNYTVTMPGNMLGTIVNSDILLNQASNALVNVSQ